MSQKAAERTVGVGCLIMSVFVLLPIPFANALPALSVIMLAFSLGERDGLWLLGGVLIGLVSITLVFAIFAAGAFTVLSFS